MKRDKKECYQEGIDFIHNAQFQMLEYNKKNHLPKIRKESRTIAEEEDIIINKLKGKKLDTAYFYEHLTDFFGPKSEIDYIKIISPCKIIFALTEELVTDEYFYSFYLLPFVEGKMRRNEYYKEELAYITSADGIHVYTAGLMTGVDDSADRASVRFCCELQHDIAYFEEGIAVYYKEIEGK